MILNECNYLILYSKIYYYLFRSWNCLATQNVILVELDFPRRTPQDEALKIQNQQLAQTFGIQGYPTVWFVNATVNEGKINIDKLGSTGYLAGGPKVWLETANGILKKK